MSKLKLRHLSIIFLVFCALLLSISVISAAENTTGHTDLKKTSDATVKVNDNSANQTLKNTPVKKAKVSAPAVYNEYRKNGLFKISVKNQNKKPLKKIAVKVKVYTGKKAKTYTLKTNKKGIATLNTKTLKRGTHKVEITSANKYYSMNQQSYIHIGVKKSLTLKINENKDFKNGDYFLFFKETKNAQYEKGVYVENLRVYKGSLSGSKTHHALKAKYTFTNIRGMTIVKFSTSNNMLKTKLITGYEPVTAKIWYIEE